MGRRKPLHVQRKRPHDAEQSSSSGDESKREEEAVRLLHGIGGGHQNANGWGTLASKSTGKRKKQKRQQVSYEDPILRVLERVLSSSGAEMPPLRLTFRDAWTAPYRQEALWLEWRVSRQQANVGLFQAIAAYEERMAASGRLVETSGRVTIGLEMHGSAGRVTLCASDNDDEDTKLRTALLLRDLFPGSHALWSPHLVNLVHNELLVLEIVRLRDGGQNDTIDDDGSDSFMWRVGVAWRPYRDQAIRDHLHTTLPVRNASCHRSMHHVMLWALRSAVRMGGARPQQCEYRYWKEIDVLYDQYVGRLHSEGPESIHENDDALQSVAFDIHDICARIDTQQQLARDTSDFEEASARHESGTSLLPSLRPYQKAAVSWMLSREKPSGGAVSEPQQMNLLVQFPGFKHPDGDGTLAYDPFCAQFYASSEGWTGEEHEGALPSIATFDLSSVRGGILADEMGLGKTVINAHAHISDCQGCAKMY